MPAPAEGLSYSVRFDGAQLAVEATCRGPAPRTWRFKRGGGVGVRELSTLEGQRLELHEGGVELPAGSRGLRYVYALEARARGGGSSFHSGAGAAGQFVVGGSNYLVRPEPTRGPLPVEVRFAGDVVVPWRRDEQGVARIVGRDLWDPGFHGFGVRAEPIALEGGSLDVVLLPGWDRPAAVLRSWLAQAGRELLTVRRRLPFPRVPVFLVPVPSSPEVSPFGMILWSRPPCLALYVGGEASERAFAEDWVAVHEVSHLAHPRFKPPAPWLSEGLATYYQGVARLRSGRLTAEEVWSHLLRGVRGGRGEAGGRSLAECSRRMHQLHCYRAVYWGGALFALELDLELRRISEGQRTLDDVLEGLGAQSTVEAFAARVDEVAGEPIYGSVRRAHFEGPALSGAGALLERLGLEQVGARARLVSAPQSEGLRSLGEPR